MARSVDAPGPRLEFPSGVAWRDGRLFVSDVFNHRVCVYDDGLRHRCSFGGYGSTPGQLCTPYGLDARDGLVYVCDNGNHRISVHSADDGAFVRSLGDKAAGAGPRFALVQPRDCAVAGPRDGSDDRSSRAEAHSQNGSGASRKELRFSS